MPVTTQEELSSSRRALRRARIQAALGIPRPSVQRDRDRLILPLLEAPGGHGGQFDTLPDDSVDAIVSLATAALEEPDLDALAVLLLCVETLSLDGQFARLMSISTRLDYLAARLAMSRPFLAVATQSLGYLLARGRSSANKLVQTTLQSVNDTLDDRSAETVVDLVILACFRSISEHTRPSRTGHDSGPSDYPQRCKDWMVNNGNALGLLFVETLIAISNSLRNADPLEVVGRQPDIFGEKYLNEYLSDRGVEALFPSQIAAIDGGAIGDGDHVVALPTSSGKTFLAELRIAAMAQRHPGATAIYVAPYRLLARQVLTSFEEGLAPLGMTVRDLGSGFDATSEVGTMLGADVLIVTPERLDSLVRASGHDNRVGQQAAELLDRCKLIVFDELQMLGRAGRGPKFELLLARLRDKYTHWSFLGLSAASHGADEMSEWLVGQGPISGGRRPTGTIELVWETSGKIKQRIGRQAAIVAELPRGNAASDDAAKLILRFDPAHHPVLVVETSRTAAESIAKKVAALAPEEGIRWRTQLNEQDRRAVDEVAEEIRSVMGEAHPLAHFVASGIAFHHAGVPTNVLRAIEHLAKSRLLRVLSATTTVAEGADLPFRVVVIPHLNFPGPSRRLERDLYLNIIGRAGRASAAVEGMVFVLDSDAKTLRNVVRSSLWSDATRDRVQSQIVNSARGLNSFDKLSYYFDLQSQVLGWLGDGNSYVDQQALALASKTFAWHQEDESGGRKVLQQFQAVLSDLEQRQYIVAGSPFQLTANGHHARLTGLAPSTVERLLAVLSDEVRQRLALVAGKTAIDEAESSWLASLLFQGIETLEASLWLRRSGSEDVRYRRLAETVNDSGVWPSSEDLASDISMLSMWMQGASLEAIAAAAPAASSAKALFGGVDAAKLTSDAAEYVGKLVYPVTWLWSGIQTLCSQGMGVPTFVRDVLEFGVPTESATKLIRHLELTRGGALLVAARNPSWRVVRDWLQTAHSEEIARLPLTPLDRKRIGQFRGEVRGRKPRN